MADSPARTPARIDKIITQIGRALICNLLFEQPGRPITERAAAASRPGAPEAYPYLEEGPSPEHGIGRRTCNPAALERWRQSPEEYRGCSIPDAGCQTDSLDGKAP